MNNRKILISLCLVLFCPFLKAQLVFEESTVDDTMDSGAILVYADDLDGDGDKDILASLIGEGELVWYENLDGLGNFGAKNIIAEGISSMIEVQTGDFNGDGYRDILLASRVDVYWYENIDAGSSWEQKIFLAGLYSYETKFRIGDYDKDGDEDIVGLVPGVFVNEIYFYENVDGLGDFIEKEEIASSSLASSYELEYLNHGDVNGDGFIDLVYAYDNRVVVRYNDNGNWGASETISINSNHGLVSVFIVEMNNDGRKDVLLLFEEERKAVWYLNTGDDFLEVELPITISDYSPFIYPTDLDRDGDVDIITGGTGFYRLAFYENNGSGAFSSTPNDIYSQGNEGITGVHARDLNGDGTRDVVTGEGSYFNVGIANIKWHKNLTAVSTTELNTDRGSVFGDLMIYPIPATDVLYFKTTKEISQIEVYDQLGRLVLSQNNAHEIDISSLQSGAYQCKLIDTKGNHENYPIQKI